MLINLILSGYLMHSASSLFGEQTSLQTSINICFGLTSIIATTKQTSNT